MRLRSPATNRTIAIERKQDRRARRLLRYGARMRDAECPQGMINAHDHLIASIMGLGRAPIATCIWAGDIPDRHRRHYSVGRRCSAATALLAGGLEESLRRGDGGDASDAGRGFFSTRIARCAWCASRTRVARMIAVASQHRRGCLRVARGGRARRAAAAEGRCLRRGPAHARRSVIAVQGVGMHGRGGRLARFRSDGAALVWAPAPYSLFGAHPTPAALLCGRIDILLGSDFAAERRGRRSDETAMRRAQAALDNDRLEAAVGPARHVASFCPRHHLNRDRVARHLVLLRGSRSTPARRKTSCWCHDRRPAARGARDVADRMGKATGMEPATRNDDLLREERDQRPQPPFEPWEIAPMRQHAVSAPPKNTRGNEQAPYASNVAGLASGALLGRSRRQSHRTRRQHRRQERMRRCNVNPHAARTRPSCKRGRDNASSNDYLEEHALAACSTRACAVREWRDAPPPPPSPRAASARRASVATANGDYKAYGRPGRSPT